MSPDVEKIPNSVIPPGRQQPPPRSYGTSAYKPPRLETVDAEILEVVDPILEKAWPYFAAEGLVFFTLGMITLIIPSLAQTSFFFFAGGLMIMAGLMKSIRSYRARELPGFLASLMAGVFTLIIGVILTAYNNDEVFDLNNATLFYFLLQGFTSFLFANSFYGYPYANGFRIIGGTSFVMLCVVLFSFGNIEGRIPSIFVGSLFMLEGALLFGVSLGLQRMAKGLPYLHPSQTRR